MAGKQTPAAAPEQAPQATPPKYPILALGMLQVARWVATNGIAKDKESKAEGKYKYRGIDKVLDELSMPLADAGLTVAPSYRTLEQVAYTPKGEHKGYISKVEGTVTFYDTHGNSRVVGPVPGEAFDGMDKGTSKACSVAYRNLMLLTFVAPLGPLSPGGDDHDPEAATGAPSQDNGTDAAGEPEAPAKPVGEPGFHLGKSQLAWFKAKMEQARWTEKQVLQVYHRVDPGNAKDVAEYMLEHPQE